MSISPLELVPGESLGPFQLGSLLFNVLNHLRSYRQSYPSVKLLWDDSNPATSPIYLILSKPPLHLTFESKSQRLLRIELNPSFTTTTSSSTGSWVSYRGKLLTSRENDEEDEEDVVRTVRRVLGPTYLPAKPSSSNDHQEQVEVEEMLSYPGVTIGVTDKGSKLNRVILTPIPAPTTDTTSRGGGDEEEAWLNPTLPPSPVIATGDLKLAEINIDPLTREPISVTLNFHQPGGRRPDSNSPSTSTSIEPVELKIGETTNEDLLCQLGSSVRIFWKEDDRMSIHTTTLNPFAASSSSEDSSSHSSVADPSLTLNPYFLSYPHLGLTLLLATSGEGNGDLLYKILLHSNLPGQYNFGRNSKCNWRINVVSPTRGKEEEDLEEGEDQEGEVEIGIGGEEQFSRIKEFFLTKRGGGRGRGGERKKESSSTSSASSSSSQPPIITTPSSPLPIPTSTSTTTTGDATSNSSSSSNNKKKKKSKTNATITSSLKEIDLLGSSLESSPTSSSPLQQQQQSGRAPSPLRNADTEEEQEKEKGEVIEMVETKPMILDRTAYASTNSTSRDVNHDRAELRTTEIHGFPGIAFEVTKQGNVETVWIF
ncbi:hypothetical protein JCM5350_004741 [Sporobolomyces pararoseus]